MYNIVQMILWGGVFLEATWRYFVNKDSLSTTYEHTMPWLLCAQTLAALEIGHVMIRWVPGSVSTAFFQIFSRLFVTWIVCYRVPSVPMSKVTFVYMVMAWAISDWTRYAYYTVNILLGFNVGALRWIRYSFFIVLLPVGTLGEVRLMISSLLSAKQEHVTTFLSIKSEHLINPLYYVTIASLLTYPTGFVRIYTYMLRQRRTHLGTRTIQHPKPTARTH
jgi:very-long-chain (3R)-3-hydroxyacyl-CoA dehydratase